MKNISIAALSPLKIIHIGEAITAIFNSKCVLFLVSFINTLANINITNILPTNDPRICSSLKKLVILCFSKLS